MSKEFSLEELEKYCTREGIRNFAKMQKDESDYDSEYHRGLATGFFWVTSCIQNKIIPEKGEE